MRQEPNEILRQYADGKQAPPLFLHCLESMNERKGFTTFFQNIPKDAFFCGDLRIHKTCFSPIILCQHEITENVGLFRTQYLHRKSIYSQWNSMNEEEEASGSLRFGLAYQNFISIITQLYYNVATYFRTLPSFE